MADGGCAQAGDTTVVPPTKNATQQEDAEPGGPGGDADGDEGLSGGARGAEVGAQGKPQKIGGAGQICEYVCFEEVREEPEGGLVSGCDGRGGEQRPGGGGHGGRGGTDGRAEVNGQR